MKNKAPQSDSVRRSEVDPTPDTPVFNFDDFTDYVAFHTKCDLIEHGSSTIDKKMSEKKCRFCD